MAKTSTTIIPLGFKAPPFSLYNPYKKEKQRLEKLASKKATVLIFMCNHCPFVINVLPKLVEIANIFMNQGVAFVGINSNDIIKYPDDSPLKMIELIKTYKIPFPYLFDETQEIAKKYSAACTPDFSVFDGKLKCVYRGQMDDSRPGNQKLPTGLDLSRALKDVLQGKGLKKEQKPSLGCNIKWKE